MKTLVITNCGTKTQSRKQRFYVFLKQLVMGSHVRLSECSNQSLNELLHFSLISLLTPTVFSLPPGGIMSSFLMGCYDPDSKKWCTVTKCSGGYDDATLARLQKELDVVKISKVRGDPTRVLHEICRTDAIKIRN